MMNECTTITTISGGWQATSRPVVLCVGYVSSSQPSTSCISHFMCLHLMGQRLPTLAMMGCQFSTTTTTTTLAGRSASFSEYWHLDRNQPGHLHSLRRRVPFILPGYRRHDASMCIVILRPWITAQLALFRHAWDDWLLLVALHEHVNWRRRQCVQRIQHTHTHTHNLNSGRAAVNGASPYTACPPACLFPCPLLAIREPHWVGLVFLGALLYAPPEIALLWSSSSSSSSFYFLFLPSWNCSVCYFFFLMLLTVFFCLWFPGGFLTPSICRRGLISITLHYKPHNRSLSRFLTLEPLSFFVVCGR